MTKTDRVRCEKSDLSGGSGCVREARHKGRCTIRPGARAAFDSGEIPPLRAGAGTPARGQGKGGLGPTMRRLVETTERIEVEAAGLMADCREAVNTVRRVAEGVNAKNVALLKALVKSRREVHTAADIEAADGDDGDDDDGDALN